MSRHIRSRRGWSTRLFVAAKAGPLHPYGQGCRCARQWELRSTSEVELPAMVLRRSPALPAAASVDVRADCGRSRWGRFSVLLRTRRRTSARSAIGARLTLTEHPVRVRRPPGSGRCRNQEFSAAAPTVSDQRLSECRSPVQKSVRGWVAEALFGALIKA